MPGPIRSFRSLLLLASLGLLSCAFAQSSAQTVSSSAHQFLAEHPALRVPAQSNRIAEGASLAERTRAIGHIAPYAKTAARVGVPAADAPLRLTAVLTRSPEVQAAFEQLLQDQQNPSSPMYHQWLTPQQLGELYGPTTADVAAVSAWLTSAGFQIDSVDPSRMRIHFSTTFGSAANVLQTEFANFSVRDRTLFAVTTEPSLPSALSGVLGSILGLSQKPVYPQNIRAASVPMSTVTGQAGVAPAFTSRTSGSHYLSPGDFNKIYDITSVQNSGFTGTGQRIAVIGQSRVTPADISNYESLFGLPSNTPNVVIPTGGTDPGITSSDGAEQTLDVERVIGVAPGATIDLVVSGDITNDYGLDVALDWNVNNLVDKVMSVSYGTCEADYSAADSASNDNYFAAAASEGITTLASSGDSGVQGCSGIDKTFTSGKYISGFCASSYVTCVGGTEFAEGTGTYWNTTNDSTLSSVLSYIPEGGWNDPSYTTSTGATAYEQAASGGGPSLFVAKPSWQTGTGVPADGKRDVPDISFTASADHDGYLICLSPQTGCSSTASNSSIAVFGGTSASAPGMAGVVVLMNQKSGSTTGSGNINPLIYQIAASTPSAFHDATIASSLVANCNVATPSMCNNSTPGTNSLTGGVAGYSLATGYDLVTGLGSLDVANFLGVAVSGTGTGTGSTTPRFTITPAASSISFTSGSTSGNTNTVSLASVNSFAGTVTLGCSISSSTAFYQPTCSVAPTNVTLTAGGTGSAVVTIGSTAAVTVPQSKQTTLSGIAAGGAALALLLFCSPLRRRRAFRSLATLLMLVGGLALVSGCGSGGNAPAVTTIHSSAATYTVTVTGSGNSSTASTSFTVTIN